MNPGEAAAIARVQRFRLAPQLVEPADSISGAEFQRALARAIKAGTTRLFRYCPFAELDAALALGDAAPALGRPQNVKRRLLRVRSLGARGPPV
jgi:hypothetical protein